MIALVDLATDCPVSLVARANIDGFTNKLEARGGRNLLFVSLLTIFDIFLQVRISLISLWGGGTISSAKSVCGNCFLSRMGFGVLSAGQANSRQFGEELKRPGEAYPRTSPVI